MRFELTDEQKEFQKTFRAFCEKEIAPRAHEIDVKGVFSPENWKALAEYGYFRLPFPEKYGGYGADAVTCAIAWEELTRVCASTALSAGANISLVTMPIFRFGTEDHKEKYLKKLITGEFIGSFCLTEPGCGSDAGGLKTTARRENGKYILNGTKMWISNASFAKLAVIFAKTDKTKGAKGITAFLVETDAPGFKSSLINGKLGLRASAVCEISLENVEVPEENVLGEVGSGFKIAMSALESGRYSVAAGCVGAAQGCLDASIKYAKERVQFGKPIGSFQLVQAMIAEMVVEIDAAHMLLMRAGHLKNKGRPNVLETCMAKLFASEMANRVAYKAIQIHGGYGFVDEFPVERFYRDIRATTLYEGTSEIQKLIIGNLVLGLKAFV